MTLLPEEALWPVFRKDLHLTVRAPPSPELERRVLELAEYLAEYQDEVVVELNRKRYRIAPGLTPEWLVEKVRRVLGTIALDPASSAEANERVRAAEFFTRADDGLSRTWHGPLFLSPPGGRLGLTQRRWWDRLVEQWTSQPGHSSTWWPAVFLGHSAEHWRDAIGGAARLRTVRVRFDVRPGVPSEVETEAVVICLTTDADVRRRFEEEFQNG